MANTIYGIQYLSDRQQCLCSLVVCAMILTVLIKPSLAAENPGQTNPQITVGQQALFSRLERLWVEDDLLNLGPNRKEPGKRVTVISPDTGGEGRPAPISPPSTIEPEKGSGTAIRTSNIGVFENEEFDLCSHSRFKVALSGRNPDYDTIMITSRDRTIPGIPFRGFETRIPLETKAQLFAGCEVIAGFVDVAGIIRIGLSVRENRSGR